MDLHVLINLRLVVEGATPVDFQEGCLSVQGFMALVRRARGVRVEAFDQNGQHEVDRLDGTLYIDRVEPRTFGSVDNYRRHSVADIRRALGLSS